ncbi:MAG: flagellar hook protein FlgE [Myxococcota bacterium]
MPLSSALYSGVAGLDAISTAISVAGDNIANVNTTGFKARRAEFSDILGQTITASGGNSQIGAGAQVSRVSQIFSQGTFETTARPTDLAIEGEGFFVLESDQGRFFTRAGLFGFDAEGTLVNPQGLRVQGFGIDPLTGLSNGTIGDVVVDTATSPPRTTTEIGISANLDAGAAEIPAGFDPSDPQGSSNFRTTLNVFDSLGNERPVTFFFTKTAPGAWDWTATVPPTDTTDAPANPGDSVVVQGNGTLAFDANGVLQAVAGATSFNFEGGAAAGQAVTVDFGPVAGVGAGAPTSQYSAPSAVNSFNQDGFSAGTLQAISVDASGLVSGQFSNGSLLPLAQVALANFPNTEGLESVGSNNMRSTRASGQPLIGEPDSGSFGRVRASALEQSNVDLASEFVRLIVNQRAFQANTRTISTTNELLAALVNLGQ